VESSLLSLALGAGQKPAPFVTISLAGPPVPKGRPRFRYVQPKGRPGFVTVYTPKETEDYEKALAWKGKGAMAGRAPLEGPLVACIYAMLPVPKSWSIKKRDAALSGAMRPVSKPDWDNYGKIASDALNKVVYLDDSQIVTALVMKEYCENPGLIVEIYTL
jgi:Holliday junction resolvase RusA-like endonuclease